MREAWLVFCFLAKVGQLSICARVRRRMWGTSSRVRDCFRFRYDVALASSACELLVGDCRGSFPSSAFHWTLSRLLEWPDLTASSTTQSYLSNYRNYGSLL